MNHLDLFSGIGGFAYAVDQVWPGSTHTFCDNNKFCQKVLAKHWPESKIYGDIKEVTWQQQTLNDKRTGGKETPIRSKNTGSITTTETTKNSSLSAGTEQRQEEQASEMPLFEPMGGSVRVVENRPQSSYALTTKTMTAISNGENTGLPVHTNGQSNKDSQTNTNYSAKTVTQQKGFTEYAHINEPIDILTGGFPCQPFSAAGKRRGTSDSRWLWGEMFRIIQETHPQWIIGENVRGFVNIQNGLVLEQVCADLEAEGYEVQPFIIPACAVNAPHRRDRVWIVAHLPSKRLEGSNGIQGERCTETGWEQNWLEVATRLCRMDDGLPRRVDRLKSLGNAIVPQVAIQIMKAISLIERE